MVTLRTALAGSLFFAATATAQPSSPSTASPADTTVVGPKNPDIARLIGIIPGAGHIYAGEVGHGFLYLGGTLGVLTVGYAVVMSTCLTDQYSMIDRCQTTAAITLIATTGLWVWSIVDAGRAARRTNAKRAATSSLILEPTRIPVAPGDDRTAVRLGVRITR